MHIRRQTFPRPILGALRVGLALVAVSLGCRPEGDREEGAYSLHLAAVVERSDGSAQAPARLRSACRRGLAGVDRFDVVGEAGEDVLEAKIFYGELPPGEAHEPARLLVYLRVDTPPDLERAVGADAFDATVLVTREDEKSLAQDLEHAVKRAAAVLEARVDLVKGEIGQVNELLRSRDPEIVSLVLEWLRLHPSDLYIHEVEQLLVSEHSMVALGAIETIAIVGGPAQVPALLRNLHLGDGGQVHRTYDALGMLGGPDAVAFLEFAVRNEDEPERQSAARQALERARLSRQKPLSSLDDRILQGHRR